MTDKQIIIDDQKKTIHRLQQECTEKTDTIIALGEQLKRKEQEREKLKKECEIWKNQTLTIDDEAITVQITQQQFEEYNQLKVENEELKKYKEVVDKLAGMQVILTNEKKMPMLYENAKDLKLKQLSKILTEIKEIAEQSCSLNSCKVGSCMHCKYLDEPLVVKRILQKISECEVENEHS